MEKTMLRKVLTLIVAILTTVIFSAACGKQDNSRHLTTDSNTTTTPTGPCATGETQVLLYPDADGDNIPDSSTGTLTCVVGTNYPPGTTPIAPPPIDPCPGDKDNTCTTNHAPSITVTCQDSVDENSSTTCPLTVTDLDASQTHSCNIAASNTCSGVTLTGCISANIPAQGTSSPASCTVSITVVDNGTPPLSNIGQDTITINHAAPVNHQPAIMFSCPTSVGENAGFFCDIMATDIDQPPQQLTCTVGSATSCMGVTVNGCVSANVPAQGEAAGPGSCTVYINVTDNGTPNLSNSASRTITINEVNTAPTISLTCPANVNEDTASSCTIATLDSDIPAQQLTCTINTSATTCTGVTINGCTSVNILAQGESAGPGSCTVAVNVTDNGTPPLGASAQKSITINEVNTAYLTFEWSYQQPISTFSTLYTSCCKLLDPKQPWQAQETVWGHDSLTGNSVTCEVNPQAVTDGSCQMALNTFELPMNECPWGNEYFFPAGGWQTPEPDWCSALDDHDGINYDIGYPNVYYSPTGLPQDERELYVGIVDNGQDGGNYYIDFDQVNHPPFGNIISPVNGASYTPPANFNIDVFAVDLDPGDFVDYVILYQNGQQVDIDFAGPFSFSRNNLPTGNYAYYAVIVDSHGAIYTTTAVNVIVSLPVNQPPTISLTCPASINEDTPSSCTITAHDSDIPAQQLTCTINTSATTCANVAINGCTSVSIPAQGEAAGPGSCTLAVSVTDSGTPPLSASTQKSITINEVNTAPAILFTCPNNVNEDTGTQCTMMVSDTDIPSQSLTCSVATATTCSGVTITDCTHANVPAQGEAAGPGSCIVAVKVTDNGIPNLSTTAQQSIIINEVNVAPTISLTCPANINENTASSCTIIAQDTDLPAQQLTCTINTSATTCTGVTINGCVSTTIPAQGEAAGPGSCTVAVNIVDNGTPPLNASAQKSITINEVNATPSITLNCPANINSNASSTCGITVFDPDLPPQILSCTVAPSTNCSGVTLTNCTTANIPAQGIGAPASCNVVITVQDNYTPPASATAQSTITITKVNSAPSITLNCPSWMNSNSVGTCPITITDPDVPPQVLTCSIAATTTCTGVTLATGCTAANIPAQGAANSCIVAVTVQDNYTPPATATAQKTITINHAPVITCTISPNDLNPYAPADYDITCTATDPDLGDTVTSLTFYENTIPVQTQTAGPYVLHRTAMTPNTYTYYATGIDSYGLTGVSNAITVIVRYPPYMVFDWTYVQAGSYKATLYDNCCLPIDPPQLWQAQGTVIGHDPSNGNRISCVVNQTAIANQYCIMTINTPTQPLNHCPWNDDYWFPSGGFQIVPQYCSYLDDGDGDPSDISYPTVRYSSTGLPQDEQSLTLGIVPNGQNGANYSILLGTPLPGSTTDIIIGITIDSDGDGITNNLDNCILVANHTQAANPANLIGANGLRVGDACVGIDDDNDGYLNSVDAHPSDPNQH